MNDIKNPTSPKTAPNGLTSLAELVYAPASCGKSALFKYTQEGIASFMT